MNTKTTSATAAAAAKVSGKKVSHAKTQAALPLPVVTNSPELLNIPLSQIEVRKQVRTEFDEESLNELASDIATNGVMQPIIVRPIPGKLNFVLVAGERRYRASKLAGLDYIPALVQELDEKTAKLRQLAENIQREDLNLKDTANAIKTLFDELGSLKAVSDTVKKSLPWCSKRLAAAQDLGYMAQDLIEQQITEDLELVLAVDKLTKIDWSKANHLVKKIKTGEAGRTDAREALAAAKAEQKDNAARHAARMAEYESPEYLAKQEENRKQLEAQRKEKEEAYRLDPKNLCRKIDRNAEYDDESKWKMQEDELASLDKHLKGMHEAGKKVKSDTGFRKAVIQMLDSEDWSSIELMTFMAGAQKQPFSTQCMIDELYAAVKEARE